MDVEIVAGLCGDAKIRVFFATFDQKGWIDLLDRVVADGSAPGELERQLGSRGGFARLVAGRASMRSTSAYRRPSRRGITVCAAAGDDGSGDQMQDERAHVHFPASSPFVLAVGGTMLEGEEEVVWWNSPGRSRRQYPRGGSTGGGVRSSSHGRTGRTCTLRR